MDDDDAAVSRGSAFLVLLIFAVACLCVLKLFVLAYALLLLLFVFFFSDPPKPATSISNSSSSSSSSSSLPAIALLPDDCAALVAAHLRLGELKALTETCRDATLTYRAFIPSLRIAWQQALSAWAARRLTGSLVSLLASLLGLRVVVLGQRDTEPSTLCAVRLGLQALQATGACRGLRRLDVYVAQSMSAETLGLLLGKLSAMLANGELPSLEELRILLLDYRPGRSTSNKVRASYVALFASLGSAHAPARLGHLEVIIDDDDLNETAALALAQAIEARAALKGFSAIPDFRVGINWSRYPGAAGRLLRAQLPSLKLLVSAKYVSCESQAGIDVLAEILRSVPAPKLEEMYLAAELVDFSRLTTALLGGSFPQLKRLKMRYFTLTPSVLEQLARALADRLIGLEYLELSWYKAPQAQDDPETQLLVQAMERGSGAQLRRIHAYSCPGMPAFDARLAAAIREGRFPLLDHVYCGGGDEAEAALVARRQKRA